MKLLVAILCATAVAFAAQGDEQAEALWKQRRYQEANDAFRALVAAHPKNAEYRVRWGRLFLERFNAPDAAKLFDEALEIEPKRADALLGLALVAAENYDAQADQIRQAGTGGRSEAGGGARAAGAAGARRQRSGEGGGRSAQGIEDGAGLGAGQGDSGDDRLVGRQTRDLLGSA